MNVGIDHDRAPPVLIHHDELARQPLVSLETIISLIGATKTSTGLEVYARLEDGSYPNNIKVRDAEIEAINLQGDEFHPEWNYSIKPKRSSSTVPDELLSPK